MQPENESQACPQAPPPWTQFCDLVKRLPKWVWMASAVVALGVLLLGFYVSSAGNASLRLKVQHNFRSAQISVWIDGKQVYTGKLTGATKKRFGLLPQGVQGSLSEVVPVSAGKHEIHVHVASDDGVVHDNTIGNDFSQNVQRTLSISARRDDLLLDWQGSDESGLEKASTESWITRYAGTLLLTAVGSIVSALTGYAIKEIPSQIRARRAAISKT